ncbi:solute carrier family 22 member 7-like isoform X2 [Phyllopteryx taeniolatus]|uniref:solute carrier family 22 member 7-like isoform X2 n=1 Tax=Phyllopteryx taeniolatus TaxID=161469 RepID=UPI002AD4FDFB|nr:solute carrier family 22 member 7-like isoform X2 [Phyllopteryx taeniolatus]
MKFDNILSEIGGVGKFQIKLILIQVLSRITLPCHFLLNNFMAGVPSHHCNISTLDNLNVSSNLTWEQKLAIGIPTEMDGTLSSCLMFSKPRLPRLLNSSEESSVVHCQNGWVYSKRYFKSTLATEWDLVCSRKGMNKATATIFFIGVMLGAPLFGYLSDRFGRRRLLLVSYLTTMTFAVLSALSTSYVMFVIMRFFTGMSISGISIISIVLNIEWLGVEQRTLFGVIFSLDWTLGNAILVGIARMINEWRLLILVVTSPLILALVAWRWLPESGRWLMANGKVDDAHYYINQCAEMNNRSKCMANITPRMLLESVDTDTDDNKYTFVDLFKTANMRKLAICSGIVWFGVAFTYYGITLNISGPAQAGTSLSTGLFLFINLFVSKDKWVIRTIVGVLGKAVSEASFTIIFFYTIELYPTVIRQNGVGYTSFVARLAVSISPLIMLLEDLWPLLPPMTYCGMAVLSGLVVLLLPETQNTRMPEFIEDIDKPREKLSRGKTI